MTYATQHTARSLADFYSDPASPYAAFLQEHRCGGSMPVRILRAEQDAHDTVDPAVPEISLVLSLRSEMGFRWDLGDGLTEEIIFRTGHFSFLPAHTETRFDCHGRHNVLAISIPVEPAAALFDVHNLGPVSSLDALTEKIAFTDPVLRNVALQMWVESLRSDETSDLLIDGLTKMLFGRLLANVGELAPSKGSVALDLASCRRVERFIDDHLAENITMDRLTSLVNMPRWTFASAFESAKGEPIYSYITKKRIDRVCDLLRSSDMSLPEIALVTGFVSQDDMTDNFRCAFGTIPRVWRAEVRS